jgi:hypothetical protein
MVGDSLAPGPIRPGFGIVVPGIDDRRQPPVELDGVGPVEVLLLGEQVLTVSPLLLRHPAIVTASDTGAPRFSKGVSAGRETPASRR